MEWYLIRVYTYAKLIKLNTLKMCSFLYVKPQKSCKKGRGRHKKESITPCLWFEPKSAIKNHQKPSPGAGFDRHAITLRHSVLYTSLNTRTWGFNKSQSPPSSSSLVCLFNSRHTYKKYEQTEGFIKTGILRPVKECNKISSKWTSMASVSLEQL